MRHTRVLITLRDGGMLTTGRFRHRGGDLRRADGSKVAQIRVGSIDDLTGIDGYLRFTDMRDGSGRLYELTDDGLAVARSIRNRRTP